MPELPVTLSTAPPARASQSARAATQPTDAPRHIGARRQESGHQRPRPPARSARSSRLARTPLTARTTRTTRTTRRVG